MKDVTVFVISALLSLVTLTYIIATPKEGEHYTEFYILGPGGKADNYFSKYILGQTGNVIIGIVNHEYRPVNYTMEIRLENTSLSLPENQKHISLGHNETWEEPVAYTPPFEGQKMKLEFLLFNETDTTAPYRDLYLWIDVNKTTASEATDINKT